MKWYANLKIGTKLIIGLVLVSLISGFIGVFGIDEIQKRLNSFTMAIIAIVLLNIIISVLLGLLISRFIGKPIKNLTELSKLLALGEVNFDIGVTTKDEIGELTAAFKEVAENLHRKSEVVELIASGAPNILIEVKSEKDVLSKSMQTLVNTINKVNTETDKLIKATKEGKLDTRGNAAAFNGGWSTLVSGVNELIDAFVRPFNVTAEYVDRISKGDIPPKITDTYLGDFNEIKNNLNNCIDAISRLISDANMLSEAAVEGRLSTRADAAKHQGDYRKIVDGVNSTLDAIVTPLNEAEKILECISLYDLEKSMSDNYKGNFKFLSHAINDVRERLKGIENVFVKVSQGDTSSLEETKKIGKRSENDRLMPAAIAMMQTIHDLTIEANMIANAVVEGDLSVRGDTIKFQGGYKEIIEGMNKTMVEIELPFSEISEVLSYMASGDFTHSIVKDFKGEYGKVKDAMNNMAESINEVLGNIDLAADQVAEGSRQISDGSQAMSQGATEQSSSIEELETTVSEIAKQTGQNAVNASQANNMASKARETAESGNELMKQMVKSMEEINESSANISKIIKVIDEIAFQTNMLSLNAAVEAARAGQHGKGFAVVAEEVRNLAAKSSNAVKDTTAMIESSIKKAEVGTKIADSTANALAKIVTEVENATKLVNDIAIASNQQATSISQISIGLGQVSQVVQSNSASTEQSAASIEELSSQAQLLKDMVTKFTLRKKGGNSNQGSLLNSFGKSNNLTAKSKSANERNRISLANSSLGKY